MILIFTNSNYLPIAGEVMKQWSNKDTLLLTIDDLLTGGVVINNHEFYQSILVASGKQIRLNEITGIVNLIPGITEFDLYQICEADRKYAVQELNAFLVYFFSQLSIPVINSPVPATETLTFRRHEEVIKKCFDLSIPVEKGEYFSSENQTMKKIPETTVSVFCAGKEYLDAYQILDRSKVSSLMNWLGVNYVEIVLKRKENKHYLDHVNYVPDLTQPRIMNIVFNFLISNN